MAKKNENTTINTKNNDDNCFQYALTDTLNYQNNLECISKTKPFIDQYNWKEIKTGKSLNQIINQFLLIFYMYLTILKK